MEFTEKYGEICRGIDCRNVKSCKECKIGKKINLCAAYEDTGLTPEEVEQLKSSDVSKENYSIELYNESKKLETELKSWKREAITATEQLGLIRIWLEPIGVNLDEVLEEAKMMVNKP